MVARYIEESREYLLSRRDQIRESHMDGASGNRVVVQLTDLVDDIIARIVRIALDDLSQVDSEIYESDMAIAALAGYGRRELAPFSDVDLLFLYTPQVEGFANSLVARLVRDFWDAKLVLGSSMSTISDCKSLARQDITVHTSLLEARHVSGSPRLVRELREAVRTLTESINTNSFLDRIYSERQAEQRKFGSTVHLLEPNIKKSRGGLREWHMFRWIARSRYDEVDLEKLITVRQLGEEDAQILKNAREFLLRARNDLHFHYGRAQDNLRFDDQVRLAASWEFVDRPGQLAVEQFMQQYYIHTGALDFTSDRYRENGRFRTVLERLGLSVMTRRIGGEYLMRGSEIEMTDRALPALLRSHDRIVRLFECASLMGARVSPGVREKIRVALPNLDSDDLPAARERFFRLLSVPGDLSITLRQFHRLRFLERLIPDFAHVRGLIQFNQYHKYTVDEHTFVCIQNAEALQADDGPIGAAYRSISEKGILHLALLLHDIGKGRNEDHSEVGKVIAEKCAIDFRLHEAQRESLVFLVHKHLTMAHLAFRRDTSDPQVVGKFVREVGSPDLLRKLFVLTACDIMSVGPDTWTDWKEDVLADLYVRSMEQLSGSRPRLDHQEAEQEMRETLTDSIPSTLPQDWALKHIASLSKQYLLANPAETIVHHLENIYQLEKRETICLASHDPLTGTTTYTVFAYDQTGLFSKIAGALSAKGLQILSAQISTHRDGIVVDQFGVMDHDFSGPPPQSRCDDVAHTVQKTIAGTMDLPSNLGRSRLSDSQTQTVPKDHQEPTKVRIDNVTSDQYTILDVFAQDRQGLLYTITKSLSDLNLSISIAKIATNLDQVLDVFYVTTSDGMKVDGDQKLSEIAENLTLSIDKFMSQFDQAT